MGRGARFACLTPVVSHDIFCWSSTAQQTLCQFTLTRLERRTFHLWHFPSPPRTFSRLERRTFHLGHFPSPPRTFSRLERRTFPLGHFPSPPRTFPRLERRTFHLGHFPPHLERFPGWSVGHSTSDISLPT